MAGAAAASGVVSSEGEQWHMPETGEIFSVQRWDTGASLSLEQQAVCVHRGEKKGDRYWRHPPHGKTCPFYQPDLVISWKVWSLTWDQDPGCCEAFPALGVLQLFYPGMSATARVYSEHVKGGSRTLGVGVRYLSCVFCCN